MQATSPTAPSTPLAKPSYADAVMKGPQLPAAPTKQQPTATVPHDNTAPPSETKTKTAQLRNPSVYTEEDAVRARQVIELHKAMGHQ